MQLLPSDMTWPCARSPFPAHPPRRVHLINGSVHEGLLAEVFSNTGIDTGAFVLAYAGLLENHRTVVHYEHRACLLYTSPSPRD